MQERLQDKINFDFLSGMELYRRPCSETEKKLKKLAFGKTLQLLASRPSGYLSQKSFSFNMENAFLRCTISLFAGPTNKKKCICKNHHLK